MIAMTHRHLLRGAAELAAAAALNGANARMPLGANVILPGATAVYTIAAFADAAGRASIAATMAHWSMSLNACPPSAAKSGVNQSGVNLN